MSKKASIILIISVLINIILSCIIIIYNNTNALNVVACDDKEQLIGKTKALINEKIYFSFANNNSGIIIGENICYEIYSYNNDYLVLLKNKNIQYFFTKFQGEFYRIEYADFGKAELIYNGEFTVESPKKPNYDENNDWRVTRTLNYDSVCESIMNNYNKKDLYTVYILNNYFWDKSNYFNNAEQIKVMIICENDVLISYGYFKSDGWDIGTPKFQFKKSEYNELVEKYKDTSIYSKSHLN